jgi:hypothetical protein
MSNQVIFLFLSITWLDIGILPISWNAKVGLLDWSYQMFPVENVGSLLR